MGGETVLKGTRIPLRMVLANFAVGATIPQTLAAFPALSEDDVLAAIAFAAASAQEVLPPLIDLEDEGALDDLGSFVEESRILPFVASPTDERHALSQFPEEGSPAAGVVANDRSTRRSLTVGPLAAAITVTAAMVVWWAGSIPLSRPVNDRAGANTTARPPDAGPAADAPSYPTSAIRTAEVLPPSEEPVADGAPPSMEPEDTARLTNSPSASVAIPNASPEQPRSLERTASIAIGTGGGALVEQIPAPVTQPSTDLITMPPPVIPNPVRAAAPEPPPLTAAPAVAPPSRSPAPRPEPEVDTEVVAQNEHFGIQQALSQYRRAYQQLDANAARAVWPAVDVRALARAFGTLASQQLAFESCVFDIAGVSATAQCSGSATYTPKIGNREPRPESRQWTFQLRKETEGWKIQSAQTGR